jgi:type I restriction enzyme S subunit
VLSVLIPVPDLGVQNRIVEHIDALMKEAREARTIAADIRRDTSLVLSAAVDDALRRMKAVAEIVPLKMVATAFNGRASGEGNSTVRVFKTKHVYPHTLRMDRPCFMKPAQVAKLPSDRYLRSGDVLMANIAEGTLGRVTYVESPEQGWTVDTQVMILRSMDSRERLIGRCLYYYLWCACGQKEILSRRSGIAFADKRGQTHIYPNNVLEIPVPVPPISQQTEAVTQLDAVLNQTEEMKHLQDMDSECLNQLEQAILDRAFRGTVRMGEA